MGDLLRWEDQMTLPSSSAAYGIKSARSGKRQGASASVPGATPTRVNADSTLSGTSSLSSPTVANRNLSRSGRSGRKERRKLIALEPARRWMPPMTRFGSLMGIVHGVSASSLSWPVGRRRIGRGSFGGSPGYRVFGRRSRAHKLANMVRRLALMPK